MGSYNDYKRQVFSCHIKGYVMKKLLILAMLFVGFAQAQDTYYIPDSNFRNFLNASYPALMIPAGDSLDIAAAKAFTGEFNCYPGDLSTG